MENKLEIIEKEINENIQEAEYQEVKEKTESGFVAKNYLNLKSFIAGYHIVFGVWSAILFLQIFIASPLNSVFAIPLIFFIVTSITGGIKLFKNKKGGVNYLIAAQFPQVILLQLNGFLYQFLCGQWIMINFVIDDIVRFGVNFGFLNTAYHLQFQTNLPVDGVGINLVPIILLVILLRMEELGSK